MDRQDALAPIRERFRLPADMIYLDGNSLGAMPQSVPDAVHEVVVDQWAAHLIKGWNDDGWMDLPHRVGSRIGELIGAPPESVAACDSTSINLFKLISGALRIQEETSRGAVILTDSGNFPSDLYILDSVGELRIVEPDEVLESITPDVAVVALTEVDYGTGRRHNMHAITEAAHAVGALVVWDLAHSAGAFPVDLAGVGADFAVGCGYKYLNGGPGAPGFVYIAPRHQSHFENPLKGWLGHAQPFDFSSEFRPAPGISRAIVGTPSVIGLTVMDSALTVFDHVSLEQIAVKSAKLTGLFMDLIRQRTDPDAFEILTPLIPEERGSQVSLRNSNAYPIVRALIERGVVGDFRAPDIARFGFAPLYVRYVDVWDAVTAIAEVIDSGEWNQPRFNQRFSVT